MFGGLLFAVLVVYIGQARANHYYRYYPELEVDVDFDGVGQETSEIGVTETFYANLSVLVKNDFGKKMNLKIQCTFNTNQQPAQRKAVAAIGIADGETVTHSRRIEFEKSFVEGILFVNLKCVVKLNFRYGGRCARRCDWLKYHRRMKVIGGGTGPVHGGLSRWQNSGGCSASCGGGTQIQVRLCNNPVPANGGNDCPPDKIIRTCPCNDHPCPVDGGWTDWETAISCSATCGGGILVQTRNCTNPEPANGGAFCVGECTRTLACNTQDCPACEGQLDVVFVLDSSASVGQDNFTTQLEFFKAVSNDFLIGAGAACFGALTFSYNVTEHLQLNDHPDKASLNAAIDAFPYAGTTTLTDKALKYMRNISFSVPNGDRPFAADVAVVITDGQSTNPTATKQQALAAKAAGIAIIAIGIGPDIDFFELTDIASEPTDKFVFELDFFSDLKGVAEDVVDLICNGVDGGWSRWTNFDQCSASCAGGFLTQTRTCTNPSPVNGGTYCVGEHTRTKTCNTEPCP